MTTAFQAELLELLARLFRPKGLAGYRADDAARRQVETVAGIRVDETARPAAKGSGTGAFGLASHDERPSLFLQPDGVVTEYREVGPFAATPAHALERLEELESLLARGYLLVASVELQQSLISIFGATQDPRSPRVWRSATALLEQTRDQMLLYCTDPTDVEQAVATATQHGGRLRFAWGEPTVLQGDCGSGREILRVNEHLSLGQIDPQTFTQTRSARGSFDRRVFRPGENLWVSPVAWPHSLRVSRWFVNTRLVLVPELLDECRHSEAAQLARKWGWSFYHDWLEQFGGMAKLADWDGLAVMLELDRDPYGPSRRAVEDSDDGPLLSLGNYAPSGKLLTDARGWIYTHTWSEQRQGDPSATCPEKWFEKRALRSEHWWRIRTEPWIKVQARAGKDFWKRLRAERDEASADDVNEHFIGQDLWVERGLGVGARPYVCLHFAPEDEFLPLAKRLARTTDSAPLIVPRDISAWGRNRLLREAGIRLD